MNNDSNSTTPHVAALGHLQQQTPAAVNALSELASFTQMVTALDIKTKALLTLVLAIQSTQMDCITYHTHNAITHGVTFDEAKDLVYLCAYMGGGPGMMAAEKALSVFETIQSPSN